MQADCHIDAVVRAISIVGNREGVSCLDKEVGDCNGCFVIVVGSAIVAAVIIVVGVLSIIVIIRIAFFARIN
jgi:hypothetical protein